VFDLPTWQPGDPTYILTLVFALSISGAILVASLAASMRKGNEMVRKTRGTDEKKIQAGREAGN